MISHSAAASVVSKRAMKIPLKPLVRRKAGLASRPRIIAALDNIARRAGAAEILPALAERHRAAREALPTGGWKDPASAASLIDLGLILLEARRMSLQEYIFLVDCSVEPVHSDRILTKTYPEIAELSAKLRAVEEAHGLGPNQYWPAGSGPDEHQRLNKAWDAASDKRYIETLKELERGAATELYNADPTEYRRLRERGRRSMYHKDSLVPALADTIVRYEQEARSAANARAFTAAIVLLGSAVEGLLLLRCLRSKRKAQEVATAMSKRRRPRNPLTPEQWTFEQLINVCLDAGWLPAIHLGDNSILPAGLAHILRTMRNRIHPGNVSTKNPWLEAERRDFDDADVIYTTLFATLTHSKSRKQLQEAAGLLLREGS